MKHIELALLVALGLLTGCATTARKEEPVTKAREIVPVSSWADFREKLIASGKPEADVDASIARALAGLRDMDRSAGSDRIGVAAPPFQFDAWLNTEPLTLEDLRGKVVLVRWFTDTCPFCASSSPALRALDEEYSAKGLVVLGVFHPKAGRDDPLDVERVRRVVASRQFEFPIAIDWEWRTHTLESWWLTGPERTATSVSFLLDKTGVIRFVHPGMEYHDADGQAGHEMCATDMATIRATIEQLLAE